MINSRRQEGAGETTVHLDRIIQMKEKEAEGIPPTNNLMRTTSPLPAAIRTKMESLTGRSSGSGRGEIEASEERLSPADAPRLQYAEEATNLVLEYLEDNMKDKIDERLLNELGWTEAETRAFLAKWQRMRDGIRG